MAKPFLKWAGGKGKLAPRIAERVSQASIAITRYHEPFLGGGAVFFALREADLIREASLADSNRDLIDAYTAIQNDVEGVIAALEKLERAYLSQDRSGRAFFYYEVRDHRRPRSAAGKAARLIFLNKTCYNGLYRVNSQGRFNVPHGRYVRPTILDAERLRAVARSLEGVELRVEDFAEACARAQPGDFVYLDPPYQPLSETAHFTSYTKDGFGVEEQRRLRDAFDDLTARGVPALLSNSDHPAVRELYEVYAPAEVSMGRNINSKTSKRRAVSELLVSNLDDPHVLWRLRRDTDEHERYGGDATSLTDDIEEVSLVVGNA